MHAYVSVPGGKTSYLSELRSGKEVIVVDQNGLWRTAIVGRVKIESRPLILVEAKVHTNGLPCCKRYVLLHVNVRFFISWYCWFCCRATLEMIHIAFSYRMQRQLRLSPLIKVNPL